MHNQRDECGIRCTVRLGDCDVGMLQLKVLRLDVAGRLRARVRDQVEDGPRLRLHLVDDLHDFIVLDALASDERRVIFRHLAQTSVKLVVVALDHSVGKSVL